MYIDRNHTPKVQAKFTSIHISAVPNFQQRFHFIAKVVNIETKPKEAAQVRKEKKRKKKENLLLVRWRCADVDVLSTQALKSASVLRFGNRFLFVVVSVVFFSLHHLVFLSFYVLFSCSHSGWMYVCISMKYVQWPSVVNEKNFGREREWKKKCL